MRARNKRNVIMVVDDDMLIGSVIRKGLEDLAEVVLVQDGNEVMRKYQECVPDMVILDIHLPSISGLELLKKLLIRDPKAYVVMLSADCSIDNVLQTKYKGAKGFLTKPFPIERVLEHYRKCPTVKTDDS